MLVHQFVALQYLGNSPLPKGVGIQVKDLLVERESLNHWFRCSQPRDSQTGSQYFRERAQVDDLRMRIKRLQRLRLFPFTVNLRVGIIFQNRSLVSPGEQQQTTPP